MQTTLFWSAGCLAAYLLGAIPFGLLIATCKGVDIRQVGSGNIGATNVFRCVSKPLGILTFALDLAKGGCRRPSCTLAGGIHHRHPGRSATARRLRICGRGRA